MVAINQIMCRAQAAAWSAIKSGQMLLSAAQGHSSVRRRVVDHFGVSVWLEYCSQVFYVININIIMCTKLLLFSLSACCSPCLSVSVCVYVFALCVCVVVLVIMQFNEFSL